MPGVDTLRSVLRFALLVAVLVVLWNATAALEVRLQLSDGSRAFFNQVRDFFFIVLALVGFFAVLVACFVTDKDVKRLLIPAIAVAGTMYVAIPFWWSTATGYSATPLLLEHAPLAAGTPPVVRLAHLSDLHLAAVATMEKGLEGRAVRAAAERAIRWGLQNADIVLISGDVTDSGAEAEWQIFEELLAALEPAELDRVLFVPGNHDLTLATAVASLGDTTAELNYERKSKAFALRALASAPRGWTTARAGQRVSVRAILDAARPFVDAYERYPPYSTPVSGRGGGEYVAYPTELTDAAAAYSAVSVWPNSLRYDYRQLLESVFPMVMYEDDRLIVIGLDSNHAPADGMASSGFGRLGPGQLRALDELLGVTAEKCQVLLLHHHVGLTRDIQSRLALRNSVQTRGLQLVDALDVERVLARHRPAAVVFGHLHTRFTSELHGVRLLSAASTAEGDWLNPGAPNVSAYGLDASCQVAALN